MSEPITISEQERASHLAVTIKQLLINLREQAKPQLINAAALMEHGTEDMSKEAVNKALGANPEKLLAKIKAIINAI